MRITKTIAAAALFVSVSATPALAQRFPFERQLQVSSGQPTLDVSTARGKIDVTVGGPGRIVAGGAATVRIGLGVPANAVEIAQQFAANPAIEQRGDTVTLRAPVEVQGRAITVNYQVVVPPNTAVI